MATTCREVESGGSTPALHWSFAVTGNMYHYDKLCTITHLAKQSSFFPGVRLAMIGFGGSIFHPNTTKKM